MKNRKPFTDRQLEAGLDYYEAQLEHGKLDEARRKFFEAEVEMIREMLVERAEGIIRLL